MIIILANAVGGTYERRGHYEMVRESWFILALCRFSMGIRILSFLLNLLIIYFKIYSYGWRSWTN